MIEEDSLLRRVLREPTFHFTLLAALLFLVTAVVKSQRREVIEIDRRDVERRILRIESGQGASLSAEERELAERGYIDEQILAREARIRGVDDDETIRSILHQKMLHILSGAVIQPTETELEAYYEDNRQRYAPPAVVTADEVVVVESGSGTLPAELEAGLDPEDAAINGRLEHTVLKRVTMDELSWAFGAETAVMVFTADLGEWIGPHRTARGEHWFRVNDRFLSAEPASLDSIRGRVRYDWIGDREAALLEERVAELREQYSVKFVEERSSP